MTTNVQLLNHGPISHISSTFRHANTRPRPRTSARRSLRTRPDVKPHVLCRPATRCEDTFKSISFATPLPPSVAAVVVGVVSAWVNTWLRVRRSQNEVISHEMTPVRERGRLAPLCSCCEPLAGRCGCEVENVPFDQGWGDCSANVNGYNDKLLLNMH